MLSSQVQIGRGDESKSVYALCHVVELGGDGKMLDEFCGCFHSRRRFCRSCLEMRRALFTSPATPCTAHGIDRTDDVHEALVYEASELDGRIVDAYMARDHPDAPAGAKAYQKTSADMVVQQKAGDLCIDAGDNALYELFYYANCRQIGKGLHGSCWPDILHVVLKGIVEKNLSMSLAIVYGLPRVMGDESWSDSMSILDDRTANIPLIVNLDGVRYRDILYHMYCCILLSYHSLFPFNIRWVQFRHGMSALLKTETKSMANSDNTTGLMSGGMESWKLVSALFQLMLCIGSNGMVLPDSRGTYKTFFQKGLGFDDDCMHDISEIVLCAVASCVEMYFAVTAKELRRGDLATVQYLVDCASFHHLRLSRLFKSLKMKPQPKPKKGGVASSTSRSSPALVPWTQAIGGHKMHLLQKHLVQSKVWFGADPRQIDTEMSEHAHKSSVKAPFAQSSKRIDHRQGEMAHKLISKRVVSNLKREYGPKEAGGGSKKRPHRSMAGRLTATQVVARGSRAYNFSSEGSKFARFFQIGDEWTISEQESHGFFHPCITVGMITENVTSFVARLPTMNRVEVYAIRQVTIQDVGQPSWKASCNPLKNTTLASDDVDVHHVFSSALGMIEGKEQFLRVLGIVLVMGETTDHNDVSATHNYYAAFLQPFKERYEGSEETYLPFPVMYPEFSFAEGARKPTFSYYFQDMDGLTSPAAIIRLYEYVDSQRDGLGVVETAMTFSSEEVAPPFIAIDFRRYQWPKKAGSTWGPESYSSTAMKHRNSKVHTIDVFPSKTELSRMQIAFGLESGGFSSSAVHGDDVALDEADEVDQNGEGGEFSYFLSDG